MIRGRNRLFHSSLRGGGIGCLGLGGDPPAGGSSEMDWESGEEAKSTSGSSPAPSSGGGLPAPSGGWAANPFGDQPATPAPAAGGGGGVSPPSGLTPDQFQAWLNQAISAGQTLSNTARQMAATVGAVIPSSAPAPAPTAPMPVLSSRVLNIFRQGGLTVRTPTPAANQNATQAYDAGIASGFSGSDIGLIAGAAAVAGLGYYLLTRKKGKKS